MLETELQPMDSTPLQDETSVAQERELVDLFFAAVGLLCLRFIIQGLT